MKPVAHILILCCVLWLVSCQEAPTAEVAEATEAPTEATTETPTEVPTATNTPTSMPTETAVPTETSTLTPEPTVTDTPTPEPPTATPSPTPTNTATSPPATATTAAPPPPPPPPVPASPAGNLLNNPSFEFQGASWEIQGSAESILNFYTATDNPQFVHSGQLAALNLADNRPTYFQRVTNVTPGTTYRAGVWVKVWSSSSENRLVSENPGDFGARVCLNTTGESDPNLENSICTGFVRPLDSWQYISIDAPAASDRVAILLVSGFYGPNAPLHNEVIWDDASITVSPTAATATPPPGPAGPVRPQPVAFNATALQASMNSIRSSIEQAGGLLDRLFNGENQTCSEYQGYYDDAIRSATYTGVPEDWAGIYNDYIFAVENFLATNESIDALCDDGGGVITSLNYGVARTGINDSLNRLIPAIEAANAKLGG